MEKRLVLRYSPSLSAFDSSQQSLTTATLLNYCQPNITDRQQHLLSSIYKFFKSHFMHLSLLRLQSAKQAPNMADTSPDAAFQGSPKENNLVSEANTSSERRTNKNAKVTATMHRRRSRGKWTPYSEFINAHTVL